MTEPPILASLAIERQPVHGGGMALLAILILIALVAIIFGRKH